MGTLVIMFALLGGAALIFYLLYITQKSSDDKRENQNEFLISVVKKKYDIKKYYINIDYEGIVLSENHNIVLFDKEAKCTEINFKDIMQSEIIENETSITTTSRASQIGGALVGGAVAGTVGALIGGLSGTQTTSANVKKLYIRLVTNNIDSPIKNIYFWNKETGIESLYKDTKIYRDLYDKAIEWQKTMEILIKQADQEEQKQNIN